MKAMTPVQKEWLEANFVDFTYKQLARRLGMAKKTVAKYIDKELNGYEIKHEDREFIKAHKGSMPKKEIARTLTKTITAVDKCIKDIDSNGEITTHFGVFQEQNMPMKKKSGLEQRHLPIRQEKSSRS